MERILKNIGITLLIAIGFASFLALLVLLLQLFPIWVMPTFVGLIIIGIIYNAVHSYYKK